MLPAANRPVPEVLLVVQVRIKGEKDRIVGRYVPVGAAVGEAAAFHEPETPDAVSGPVAPRTTSGAWPPAGRETSFGSVKTLQT